MPEKLLFIVTGASGGFGSAILRQLNAMYGEDAVIIACSRNPTKIAEISQDFSSFVKTISVDFAKRAGIKERCQGIFDLCKGDKFSGVTLFNNHARLNDAKIPLSVLDDHVEIEEELFLNVTSFQVLTSVFLGSFPGTEHTCVNVSSIGAVKAFNSLGLYCAGKAARLMLYRVLSSERPEVNVFNYSPGPMLTDMTSNLARDCADLSSRDVFQKLEDNQSWVDTDVSAKKMLDILKEKKYTAGQQIDFYDC